MQKTTLTWLHLSDIHFSKSDAWRDDISRDSLIEYLQSIFTCHPELRPDFIFCTGDIAFGETKSDPLAQQYESARSFFERLLSICGEMNVPLAKERLFVVPGNHDINRSAVNSDAQASLIKTGTESHPFASKINARFDARSIEFCDSIKRLDEYSSFIKSYLPHQFDAEGRVRYACLVPCRGILVGIGGFNSAWTCAGSEDDRNIWMASEWQFNQTKKDLAKADLKIGLIHHPVDWLNIAERDVATVRIASDFDFWLHGHTHSAWVTPVQSHSVIAAGAVGAEHSDEFGINLTTVDLRACTVDTHLHTKTSRSANWTIAPIHEHAPLGKWSYKLSSRVTDALHAKGVVQTRAGDIANESKAFSDAFVHRVFSKKLTESLRSFSTYSSSWVGRVISESSELDREPDKSPKLDISEFVANPYSCVINAPPQYGLTCLAHYLALEAWSLPLPSLFLYLDAKSVAPHKSAIEQLLADELQMLGKVDIDVKAIILDSWSVDEKEMVKILSILSSRFSKCALIVMQQTSATNFTTSFPQFPEREFKQLFLWSLSRNVMRNIVASYNEVKSIGDEDAVTTRLADDLDVLNLHRTPINCITLLKVSEFDFDENPVNRSEIIKRVLFLLFNVDNIPNYKSRPDLKDCEYVLGRFCEILIRTNTFQFARDKFLLEVQKFCKESLIDLETHLVFDVLFQNNIIVRTGNYFHFKFAYWIYYFAAHRMHHDEKFAAYIFEEMRYSRFPEIVEFYTGIDRMRNDALSILITDLKACHTAVREKSGLPEDVNPYKFAVWATDENVRVQMQQELADGVRDSNLPAVIKDQYADRSYNKARPYNQGVRELMSEFSYLTMLHAMSAGARALRNSDYADPEIKRQLLREIMRCWNEATRVLFIVLPLLVERGHAAYDGMGFYLNGDFGDSEQQRFISILCCIPTNVMRWGKEDLYSRKMAPLLVDRIEQADVGVLEKHELILLLISARPRDWEKSVQRYIAEISRNSFYLMDVYQSLRGQYRMGFFPNLTTQKNVEFLIKMAGAKHLTGEKKPTEKSFKSIKFDAGVIPERQG